MSDIDKACEAIFNAAIDVGTRKAYERAWSKLKHFSDLYDIELVIPISRETLLRFISYLFLEKYAYASIQSIVSAVTFYQRNGSNKESSDALIKMAMLGVRNLSPPQNSSLPMHIELIERIMDKADTVLLDNYTKLLFKAMTTLAFFALLRVGEYTYSQHTLKFNDVKIFHDSMMLRFVSFKYSQGKSSTHNICARSKFSICPVFNNREYLKLRGSSDGFWFVKINGRAPSRKEYWDWMKAVLENCKIDSEHYTPHSLRSGMATYMALSGASTEQIKIAGRWHSDAYKKYIRVTKV